MDDLVSDKYSIQQNKRIGMSLITFYKESQPLGSLLLDPVEDKLIIESIDGIINSWNLAERERAEKASIRQHGSKGKRNGPKVR